MKLSFNDYDGDGAGEGNALWKRKMFNNVIRLLNKSSKTLLPRAYTFWCIFLSSLHDCYVKGLYVKSWPGLFKRWIALSNIRTTGTWGRVFIEGGLDVSSESQAPLYLRPSLFQVSFLGCNGDVNWKTYLKGFYEITIDKIRCPSLDENRPFRSCLSLRFKLRLVRSHWYASVTAVRRIPGLKLGIRKRKYRKGVLFLSKMVY